MAGLVAEVAQQGAVRLVHLQAALLALGVVGLGDVGQQVRAVDAADVLEEDELPAVVAVEGFHQNSALPGTRGKGITSRMLPIPVTNCTVRSRPRPKPACGTVPNRRRSRYHQ